MIHCKDLSLCHRLQHRLQRTLQHALQLMIHWERPKCILIFAHIYKDVILCIMTLTDLDHLYKFMCVCVCVCVCVFV